MPRTADPTLKTRILEAGVTVIRRGGPHAFQARAVVAEAGCAVGAIYRAYGSLDHLGEAINVRTLNELLRALRAIAAASPSPNSVAMGYIAFARTAGQLWQAVFLLPRPPAVDGMTPLQSITAVLFDFAETIVAGAVGPAKAPRATRLLWTGLHGLTHLDAMQALNLKEGETMESIAADLVRAALGR